MLEPKYTLVGLAGQKAWHIWTAEPPPRVSGKYLPSQLRTQKAGPEAATVGRDAGGATCWLMPRGSNRFACGCCVFCRPPNKKSKRPSAPAEGGGNRTAAARIAATDIKRRRL